MFKTALFLIRRGEARIACAYNEIKKNKKKQKILRIHEKAQEVS